MNSDLGGFLLIDKPQGVTSFAVVACIRKLTGVKKVGHAGTLDPIATGLLILALGKATKSIDKIAGLDKTYWFTLCFGTRTDTDDLDGRVIAREDASALAVESINAVLPEFRGSIMQTPPQYSAIKISGRRAYKLARSGIEPGLRSRPVTVFDLALKSVAPPLADFVLHCSKGTYVRALGRDLGERLGCGACVSQIRRTQIGPFGIEDALSMGDVDLGKIVSGVLPLETALNKLTGGVANVPECAC